MTPWIKCENGLPPIGMEVMAYAREFGSDKYEIVKAIYYDRFEMKSRKPEYKFYECCHCSGQEYDEMMIDDVKAWTSLPKPPGEK